MLAALFVENLVLLTFPEIKFLLRNTVGDGLNADLDIRSIEKPDIGPDIRSNLRLNTQILYGI
jgi:hypothetical protein